MAKKRRRREEDKIDESWLLPYADMLTLLLAIFIVLFAGSTMDAQKYYQIMAAFNEQFKGGTGILEHPAPPKYEREPSSYNEDEADQAMERFELQKLQEQIDRYIDENGLENYLETDLSTNGLLLTILDHAFFHSGSAEVRVEARNVANSISELLVKASPRKIVVAGHTDDVPISNAAFQSNWDLSAYRALNFMKVLLENEKLDPRDMSATGYGEYAPIATNETEEGREKNRRVEVLIMPRLHLKE